MDVNTTSGGWTVDGYAGRFKLAVRRHPRVRPVTGKAQTLKSVAGAVVVLLVLLLLASSHRFGRAQPTGDYRPDLPPEALATGCYPLPSGVTFSFQFQTRRDGDVVVAGAARRRYVGQYHRIDEDEARAAIIAAFVAAGFVLTQRSTPYDAVLRRSGDRLAVGETQTVRLRVEQLVGVEEDTVVRGVFVLDLPAIEAQRDDDVCDDPKSTKRWTEETATEETATEETA